LLDPTRGVGNTLFGNLVLLTQSLESCYMRISLRKSLRQSFHEVDGSMMIENALQDSIIGSRKRSGVVGVHCRAFIEHGGLRRVQQAI
jgi:hypothetical protein